MVIIIGSGPIGLACGIELKNRNIPFRIIEKGCLANSIYQYPANMTFFSTSEKLEIGDVPFISHGVKPTRNEALEYLRRITQKFELPVQLYEKVTAVEAVTGSGTVKMAEERAQGEPEAETRRDEKDSAVDGKPQPDNNSNRAVNEKTARDGTIANPEGKFVEASNRTPDVYPVKNSAGRVGVEDAPANWALQETLTRFVVRTDKGEYQASHVIIATGFYDKIMHMNVPGEDLPKVKHYYDDPHPYFKQKVLVVGGGNSAVDAALETYRCGAEVTMAVRDTALKDGVKYWVRPDIENRIAAGEIRAWFNSVVKEIGANEVILNTPEGEKRIENDFVLAMTGYQPDYALLDQLGLECEADAYRTPVLDEESQESSVKGIYLAGVICGGKNTSRWFIENTRIHAEAIAASIMREYPAIPHSES